MKRIETYEQLKAERLLTKQRIAQLEFLIENDVAEIKNSLQPLNVVGNTVKDMISSEKDGVIGESINLTVDALIKKLLLRRSNWILKLVVSFVLKNYAKNLFSKNSGNILNWVTQMLRGRSNGSKEYYHADSEVNWDA